MGPSQNQRSQGRATSPALLPAADAYPYNDELLLSEGDRQAAQRLYPNIYPALDFPELRAIFSQIDPPTNAAKRWSRRWGIVAVLFVVASLLGASLERFYGNWTLRPMILGLAAVLGIVGVIVGLFGVLFARTKRAWLCGRLVTERLRQLHFQLLIALAPDLLAATRTHDWSAYAAKRRAVLETFAADVIPRASLVLDDMVLSEDAEAVAEHLCWLAEPLEAPSGVADEPHLEELLRFYRRLRIARQVDYCRLKLRTDRRNPFADAPKAQASFYEAITLGCILLLVGIHAAVLVMLGMEMIHPAPVAGKDDNPWTLAAHPAVVILAIATLAARTLEEGLQPKREIERYRNYKNGLENIAARFDRATDVTGQFAAMRELEELSFDEMVSFLKSNAEAKFVM